MPFGETQ
jgi:hypothetical protein